MAIIMNKHIEAYRRLDSAIRSRRELLVRFMSMHLMGLMSREKIILSEWRNMPHFSEEEASARRHQPS